MKRALLRCIIVASVITMGGCIDLPASSESTSQSPTPDAVSATTSPSPTTTSTVGNREPTEKINTRTTISTDTATPEPVVTGNSPYNLRIRNFRNETVTLHTTVRANDTEEIVFNQSVTLTSSARSDFTVDFPAKGNYTVTTTDSDGAVYQYIWNVEYLPPTFDVIVTADPRGNVTHITSSA